MSRTRRLPVKWINLTVLVLAIVGGSLPLFPRHTANGEWQDLVEAGGLRSIGRGAFQRCMPRRGGRTPLVVTLCKPAGGSHNRIWSLHIREGNVWQPDETWSDFEDLEDWPPRAGELTTVRASDDNENCLTAIFNLRHPGFWYRETPSGYQFLIHQHEHPHVGDQRCLDGYYTWTERDAWRHSDKNGTPGEPLKR